MRQITEQAVSAFESGVDFKKSNMLVSTYKDDYPLSADRFNINDGDKVAYMFLHGNLIAVNNLTKGEKYITNAGWFSKTTKERLNGITGVNINQTDGEWFLNGVKWNGEMTNLNEFNDMITSEIL